MESFERTAVFSGDLAPTDHVLQVYADEESFLDMLEAYVGEGLAAGEGVIVIATASHRAALARRLTEAGFDLEQAVADDRYLALSAQDTLDRFMVEGSPDGRKFENVVSGILERARRGGRQVRAFGEMVALLWARGNRAATVRLEQLWNGVQREEKFPLCCAYPRFGFTPGSSQSVQALCAAHTRIFGI
jgi:hypothetical protein